MNYKFYLVFKIFIKKSIKSAFLPIMMLLISEVSIAGISGGGSHFVYEFYYEHQAEAESACNDWYNNVVQLSGSCGHNTLHSSYGGGFYRNPITRIFYYGSFDYGYVCPQDLELNNETGECEPPILPNTPPPESVANYGDCDCDGSNGTNPINGATGNKYQRESDYKSSSSNSVLLERYYNSDATALKPGQLGAHWRSTYDRSIDVTIDVTTSSTVIVNYRPDGQGVFFTESSGSWVSTIDLTLQLIELKDAQGDRTGWQLTDRSDNIEVYDADGKLLSITNRQGQVQTLSYNVAVADGGDDNVNTLDSVIDSYGRELNFTYNTTGLLISVTDPEGKLYGYSYDANNNLEVITYPDETLSDDSDNPTRVYHYEDANFPNALTGITDEIGNRFASWGYDAQGHAIYSEHANGVERSDIVYNADGTTTITNALGQVRTYHFETHNSMHVTSQVDGDQCVNCGGQYKAITYDSNGFVASRTDFNNNVTTYVNDVRGLELSRTEAVGTAEERTITTEWHMTFRLPIKITEPGKITTFTYDTQGRLLERKEEQ